MADHAGQPGGSNHAELASVALRGEWQWNELARPEVMAALAAGLPARRWFGSKTRTIRALGIVDQFELGPESRLVLVRVQFDQGDDELYQLPLATADGEHATSVREQHPRAVWANLRSSTRGPLTVLYDPLVDANFCQTLLALIDSQSTIPGASGQLTGWRTERFASLRGGTATPLTPRLHSAEQSNSSIVYGDRLILKLFRRVEQGLNPDLEITQRLTDDGFAHVPPLAGAIEYRQASNEPWSLAVLQGLVPTRGDAWSWTLERLDALLERAAADGALAAALPAAPSGGIYQASEHPLPAPVLVAFDPFIADAQRLGTRTAELHAALAAQTAKGFAIEPFSDDDRRKFAARAGELARETCSQLRAQLHKLEGSVRQRAERVLALEPTITARFARFADQPLHTAKIRCHGDFHLGQVLVVSNDFVIIDFEGEPARPLAERRAKNLAIRDVAGIIRSFHYASCAAAATFEQRHPDADRTKVRRLADAWYFWTSVAFLAAYRRAASAADYLPHSGEETALLLEACLLEKAIYELRYELNNRPDWLYLPLEALDSLLASPAA